MNEAVQELTSKLGCSKETIRRYYTILEVIRSRDHRREPTPEEWEEIEVELEKYSSGYAKGISQKLFGEVLRHYRSWEQTADEQRQAARNLYLENHLRRLYELAEKLRSCLYNPRLNQAAYFGPERPMMVNGRDWSLDPDGWLAVTTPDLESTGLWGPDFESLRSHLRGSPFWEHLEELKTKVGELKGLYERAAARLAEQDEGFMAKWKEVTDLWRPAPSRTPFSPEIPEDARPTYGEDYTKKVCDRFEGLGFRVYDVQYELVLGLQRLNDDLLPDEVERLIAEGTCRFCE